jgi:cytochrome c-type biogenesis protein
MVERGIDTPYASANGLKTQWHVHGSQLITADRGSSLDGLANERESPWECLALTVQAMTFTLPALFLAGLLTFLSPCVLPLVPIYLAMLAGTSAAALREGASGKRLVLSTISFALGLSLVFVLLGLAASAVGNALSSHRTLVLQLAGLAVFLAGLKLMGFVHIPWLDREARPWLAKLGRGGGLAWPFLFGAAFALGWSPCVGPVLASVLAFAGSTGSPTTAAAYLGIYALGLTSPLVAVSFVAPVALRLLDRAKQKLRVFELASGTLLAAMGLVFISAGAAVAPEALSTTSGNSAPSAPTMLEFVAEGCPICQRMQPVVAAAEQHCGNHGVRVQQVDVSTQQGRALASRHGILGVPTFLLLDRNGGEIARLVGQQPQDVLVQSLEVLAGHKCDGFRALPKSPAPGT